MRNRFLIAQHLFLDWTHAGSIEPRSSGTFDVPLGTHTLTSADSTDPDDNPVSVTESFESGYGYAYEIVPE